MKILILVVMLALVGCGSGDNNGDNNGANNGANNGSNNGSNNGAVDFPDECGSKCDVKASDCGIIRSEAQGPCAALCAGATTQDQVDCIEMSECAAFEPGLENGLFCELAAQ